MRLLIVIGLVLLSVPIALLSPYYGVLIWTWIAYFNPHRYLWGAANDFPVALVIAIPTLIGTIFARKNPRIVTRESVLLLLLWIWFCITTAYISFVPAFTAHVADAHFRLEEVSKVLLMTIVTMLLVINKERLRIMVTVIALSFGIRALVAAIFVVQTAGQYRVWGPEGTFIGDNNDFALALNMSIPLFFFLARSEEKPWLRLLLRVLMLATIIAVIGTYSRGGLLGLTAIAGALLLKSQHKLLSAFLVVLGVCAIVTLSAAGWKDRMADFANGQLDQSAQSRLGTWQAGWKLALDYPITGGGFEAYPDGNLMAQYIPASTSTTSFKGPHSIYFQMLGEQGFVGLSLFLLMLGCCLLSLRKIRRLARIHEQLRWAVPYTDMFEVSLLAYIVSGATLGRAYFDLMYQIIACVVVLKIFFMRNVRTLETENVVDILPADGPQDLTAETAIA